MRTARQVSLLQLNQSRVKCACGDELDATDYDRW